jgi:hypothetical protein
LELWKAGVGHLSDSELQPYKWKNGFIENDAPRDINMTCGDIQALETLVHIAIAKEGTSSGSILEFMRIIQLKVGPASTTKDSEARVVESGA